MPKDQSSYDQLGVSASKSGLHDVLKNVGLEESTGLFIKITEDLCGDSDYCSFSHSDGAGTKTIVPYLYFRDTGSTSLFRGLAQDALVMNLDDVFAAGLPEQMILSNTIGRNSRLINDTALGEIISSYKVLTEMLSTQGIKINLCGGETADCGDVIRTLVVDATISGRIKKTSLINTNSIAAGDVIVGLSSTGQASYETIPNSGIGSNGLTLARHALLNKKYREQFPEVADPGIANEFAYRGPFSTTDKPEGLEMDIGTALASPTRTYAPVLKKLFNELPGIIHGIIHVTGGGLTKVLRFGNGLAYVKSSLFPVPPLFSLIQKHGNVSWKEMYRVFNMGQRIEIYLPEGASERAIEIAAGFSIDAKIIGRVEKSDSANNTVQVQSEFGTFDYTL